jgi:hypothetical protein
VAVLLSDGVSANCMAPNFAPAFVPGLFISCIRLLADGATNAL